MVHIPQQRIRRESSRTKQSRSRGSSRGGMCSSRDNRVWSDHNKTHPLWTGVRDSTGSQRGAILSWQSGARDHDILWDSLSFFRGYPWFSTYFYYTLSQLYTKMSLTQAQIAHLAKLTSLRSQEWLEISSVLDSFASLSRTDTSHISTISRSGQGSLGLRPDVVIDAGIADDLLACSGQKKAAHQIVLGGIMVWE